MAKKKDAPVQQETGPAEIPVPAEAQPQTDARPPVSSAQVLGFWGFLLLIAASAWLMDFFMPGIKERVVERWLMLPLAGFMVFTLYRLR